MIYFTLVLFYRVSEARILLNVFFHVLTSADSSNIDITGLTDLKDILGFMKHTAVV